VSENGKKIDSLDARLARADEKSTQLFSRIEAAHKRLELLQDRVDQRLFTKRDSADMFRQMEALAGLYLATESKKGFPATRDWVASPDLLLYLHEQVKDLEPTLILECGSGLSTVIMAYALKSNGRGRLVSLEHLQEYVDRTNSLLSEHGLSEWAEVRHAPIEDVKIDTELWPWYALNAVPDGPIDVLLVDGPPGTLGPMSRFPAVPLLRRQLSNRALILLDDYARADEHDVADRWLELFPDLMLETLKHEKGTAVLRFRNNRNSNQSESDV
jgi:predicted O-methyltransferase YrrM